MNGDERTIGRRLLRALPSPGYLLADSNYDSNRLFALARERQVQMVVPRRYGATMGLGHRRHDPARLRCLDLLENTVSPFGRQLHRRRRFIEYYFGRLSSGAGGLNGLPSWVRTHRRVHAWVQIKLILNQLRADRKASLRAA